jgi:hypothetical protein
MRAVALIVGVGLALAGLTAAQDHLLLWQQAGFDSPMRLGTLWTDLWGTPSDPMWLCNCSWIEAWLMHQPVSTVLPVVGVGLAWIGMDGIGGLLSVL